MFSYRQAKESDLREIAALEKIVSPKDFATLSVLRARQNMFPSGFWVAETKGNGKKMLIGYVMSCRWNREEYHRFEDVADFPSNHNPRGANLYVIFLAVHPDFRRQGVGSELLSSMIEAQRKKYTGISKVQLVALDTLRNFYERMGFKLIRELPEWLSYAAGLLMQKSLR